MVVQCCVCQKVREGKEWIAVEAPYLTAHIVSHTYCPVCEKVSLRELKEMCARRFQVPQKMSSTP